MLDPGEGKEGLALIFLYYLRVKIVAIPTRNLGYDMGLIRIPGINGGQIRLPGTNGAHSQPWDKWGSESHPWDKWVSFASLGKWGSDSHPWDKWGSDLHPSDKWRSDSHPWDKCGSFSSQNIWFFSNLGQRLNKNKSFPLLWIIIDGLQNDHYNLFCIFFLHSLQRYYISPYILFLEAYTLIQRLRVV